MFLFYQLKTRSFKLPALLFNSSVTLANIYIYIYIHLAAHIMNYEQLVRCVLDCGIHAWNCIQLVNWISANLMEGKVALHLGTWTLGLRAHCYRWYCSTYVQC